MSHLPDQIFIDVFVAQRDGLLSAEVLAQALEKCAQSTDAWRLSTTLRREQLASPQLCQKIDALGDSYAAVLHRLGLQPQEPQPQMREPHEASASAAIDAAKHDAATGTEDDARSQELETFMEEPSSTGTPSAVSGSPTASGTPASGDASRLRYQKNQPHAEGGLGRVWVASDLELNRRVALKEIQPAHADDPSCRNRFLQEAEITGSLEHPGIVPVYGLGCHADGRPFYAMRFVEGKTLRGAIDELFDTPLAVPYRDGRWVLQLRRALGWFLDVCNTLDYAHSRNIIHRDIKPSNVMLGAYGETLVVDWGLAKNIAVEDAEDLGGLSGRGGLELTMLGAAVGTPAYMSPEQASGGRDGAVGVPSDIFSLGATLFHLLVGSPPIGESDAQVDTAEIRLAATDLSPADRRPGVPKPLVSICRKAMALDPEKRYPSAKALANDVENWLADQPVTAHQETAGERSARWIRSHPTLMATAVVATILLVVASIAGLAIRNQYQLDILREQQERQRLSEAHLQRVESAADAAAASALIEIRNSRFSAALEFLDQALEQIEEEPPLSAKREDLWSRRRRTARLREFYRYLDQAQDLTFDEHSRRSTVLFQNALRQLKVFEQIEWWNHLPDEDLDARQIQKLREDAYLAIYLLVALRLKETLPGEYTIEGFLSFATQSSKKSNEASLVLFDLMDAYRHSQGSELGREFAQNRLAMLQQVVQGIALQRQTIEWNAQNAADLYIMGSALAFFCDTVAQEERQRFEAVLGLADAEQTSLKMLQQAADLQPDHYFTQMMLGHTEWSHQQFENSYKSYTHAIALRPSHWAAYQWRGRMLLAHALSKEKDAPERLTLLHRAQRDLERSIDLDPTQWYSHKMRGDVLTWTMVDNAEAIPSYETALMLAEPLASIRDLGVENSAEWQLKSIRDWCLEVTEIEPNKAEAWGCHAWAEYQLGHYEKAAKAVDLAQQSQGDSRLIHLVNALTMLDQEDYTGAEVLLARLYQETPGWFHVNRARGECAERTNQWKLAREMYQEAASHAQLQWQQLAAQRGLVRVAVLTNGDNVTDLIQDAIRIDPTDDFQDLWTLCGENDLENARQLLLEHQESLAPVASLNSIAKVKYPALMNGGFELGLTEYWGNTLDKIDQPAWQRSGASLAVASLTPTSHRGDFALQIINTSKKAEGRKAELSQSFPVRRDARYRLSLWAKSQGCVDSSVLISLAGEEGGERIEIPLPAGNYEWTALEGEFLSRSPTTTLRITCLDQADVVIDDLVLERIE